MDKLIHESALKKLARRADQLGASADTMLRTIRQMKHPTKFKPKYCDASVAEELEYFYDHALGHIEWKLDLSKLSCNAPCQQQELEFWKDYAFGMYPGGSSGKANKSISLQRALENATTRRRTHKRVRSVEERQARVKEVQERQARVKEVYKPMLKHIARCCASGSFPERTGVNPRTGENLVNEHVVFLLELLKARTGRAIPVASPVSHPQYLLFHTLFRQLSREESESETEAETETETESESESHGHRRHRNKIKSHRNGSKSKSESEADVETSHKRHRHRNKNDFDSSHRS